MNLFNKKLNIDNLGNIQKVGLKSTVKYALISQNRIMVKNGDIFFNLYGEDAEMIFYPLLQFLNEAHTLDEILAKMSYVDCEIIKQALGVLNEKELITFREENSDNIKYNKVFNDSYGFCDVETEELKSIVSSNNIGVIFNGELSIKLIEKLKDRGVVEFSIFHTDGLSSSDVNELLSRITNIEYKVLPLESIEEYISNIDIMVCILLQNKQEIFDKVNKAIINNNCRCLFGTLDNTKIEIGPFVIPGETACYNCSRHRKLSNLAYAEMLELFDKKAGCNSQNDYSSMSFVDVLSTFSTEEIMRSILRYYSPELLGKVLTIDFREYSFKKSVVLKIPYCKHCSSANYNPVKRVGV